MEPLFLPDWRTVVLNRWRNLCPSCFDAEAERARVRYTFKGVEAQSWSDRPPPRKAVDDRRVRRQTGGALKARAWQLSSVMGILAFMTNSRPRVVIRRVSRAQIDREEYSALYWADLVNREGVGLYGSSLRRRGPEPVCETLVLRGLLLRVDRGAPDDRGYWITELGRRTLGRTMLH